MATVIETTVFSFDELDERAKERARGWFRAGALDHEWWDGVYEDAKRIGELTGVDIGRIYFSGFCSQGDGARFEGSYSYRKGSVKAIAEYAPIDAELGRIVRELGDVQRRRFYSLSANIRLDGRYEHEGCTSIDVSDRYGDLEGDDAETVRECLRDLMRWIYRTLEAEHDYLMADEQVDESIRSNEYTFTESGEREG